ncbi:neck passage structure [Lactococcus phage 16802]|uniref:Neck passage structure n=1 Tax=Lactococcus phage 16802 TaxID=2029659 RepID=A0A343JNN9_9CAUD|nr:neck passage structure [Lactococcus phage 16802]ASZ71112.1 neck passage structure [Lactococcus phage 16802]
MSLDNFRNRTIIWDTVNKDFPQPIQAMQGDVNARTLLIKIVDNGVETDLTGHSLKLTYQYTNGSNSGFVMIPPKNLAKGEFILVIPTEMTKVGVIEANLILLNESLEQVIVSKNLTFISDNSTVTALAQKINNNIDDFTKLLLEKMPQVLRSELNDLHAQTDSNKSNIELKANLADMTSLQSAMTELKNEVEAFGISPENLVTIKSLLDAIASNASESEVVELINSVKVLTSNISLMSNGDYSPKANQTDLESLQHTVNNQSATVSTKANQTDLDNLQATVDKQGIAISTKAEQSELSITNKNVATAQETAKQAESEAKNAMAKATEAQANSLSLNGVAVSALKLATPRKLQVNLQSSSFQYFDGTDDATNIGVSGVLPIEHGGTSTSDGVINTTAYAKSADGTVGFTTVYPNLNLLTNTKITQGYIDSEFWVPIGNTELAVGSNNGIKVINNGGDIGSIGGFSYAKPINVNVGDTITLSCYIRNTGTVDIKNFSISIAFYGKSRSYPTKANLVIPNDGKPYFFSFTTIVPSGSDVAIPRWFDVATAVNEKHIFEVDEMKLELGSIATPWLPSASEVTINDYPKYVGFSNSIKPNKKSSDYKWLPMGLVSIDRATGLLKPAVIGIDCAEAHPVGSVVTNTSSSSSGYSTGKWENIGSAVIGSTTIYYWKRTA